MFNGLFFLFILFHLTIPPYSDFFFILSAIISATITATIDEIIKPYLITVCPVLFHIKNSALALDVNDNVSVFALFTIIELP